MAAVLSLMQYPVTILKLISLLKKLPGVGSKSAERFAFHLIRWTPNELNQLIENLSQVKQSLFQCPHCHAISDLKDRQCLFCDAPSRNKATLCIVASTKDLFAIEKTSRYKGLYYVLDNLLDPMTPFTPLSISLDHLKSRIEALTIQEIIIALDSTLEGDATSLYIKKALQNLPLKVSRLAFGLPFGSSLEYVDEETLSKALIGRTGF